jgi:hypothetical protein
MMARIHVRDLFSFVLVVAVGTGWLLDHRRQQRENDSLRATFAFEKQQLEALVGIELWRRSPAAKNFSLSRVQARLPKESR